jgi:hypothetical protein
MLEHALNRAGMSVSFRMEGADIYDKPYPLIQELKYLLQGFSDALIRSQ